MTDPRRATTAGDEHDLQATVPATAWDQAATVHAVAPAHAAAPAHATVPGPGPRPGDGATIVADLNHRPATAPAPAAFDAEDQRATLADAVGPLAETVATAPMPMPMPMPMQAANDAATLLSASTGGAGVQDALTGGFNRTGTLGRTVRTRINLNLPAEAQQLDQKLQTSRTSVLSDMASARLAKGDGALPTGMVRLIEQQGTEGRYAINRPLAAGGMGAVLHIDDHDFRRSAAMKVIHGHYAHTPEALERFLAEAQVTAQLEHPNIVPIHDLGAMDDGTLYFTMKLIEGQSFGQIVKLLQQQAGLRRDERGALLAADGESLAASRTWTEEAIILAFLKVLDGVGFAHSRGVIHRDLKPDNIMLGTHGEVLVVDWGIAKVLAGSNADLAMVAADGADGPGRARQVVSIRDKDALSATITGSAMGTVFYMPPEQAKGELDDIDARSDIYALGATLYELIALRRCLDPSTLPDMIMAIANGAIMPLAEAVAQTQPQRRIHPDLIAVVHKAMALRRERRYASCGEFADDLRRHLAGQAVLARQRNLIERIGLWYAAHRRQMQLSAGAVALVAVAVAITAYAAGQHNRRAAAAALVDARQALAAVAGASIKTLREAETRVASAVTLNPGDLEAVEMKATIAAAIGKAEEEVEAEVRRQEQERALADRSVRLMQEAETDIKAGTPEALRAAYEKLTTAFRNTPGDGAVDRRRLEVQGWLANIARKRQIDGWITERAQGVADLDRAAALIAELPPVDADAQRLDAVAELIRKAEASFAKAEQLEGTQKLATETDRLRAEIERRRRIAADRARAGDLVAAAAALFEQGRAATDKERLAEAVRVIDQAGGVAPADDRALVDRINRLRSAVLLAQATFAAEQKHEDDLRVGQQLAQRARTAAAAGKHDEAVALAGQALLQMPNSAPDYQGVIALREAIVAAKRSADEEAARARRLAEADAALAGALDLKKAFDADQAAMIQADAEAARLERALAAAPVARKQPLFAARQAARSARESASLRWAGAEAAGQSVRALLADQPGAPAYARANALLADLHHHRLMQARAAGDPTGIAASRSLLRRYDGDDGRYRAELADQGTLLVQAPAGTAIGARRLAPGADGRLVAIGASTPIETGRALTLEAGAYELVAGEATISAVVAPAQATTLAWPPATLPQVPGIALRYVPAAGARRAFMLATGETTVEQYAAFINDRAVLERARKSWLRLSGGSAKADESLALIPRQVPGASDPLSLTWKLLPTPDAFTEVAPQDAAAGLPVTGISREDAEAYCSWVSARTGAAVRLPTRAEWSAAARGGDARRIHPWGEVFDGGFAVTAYARRDGPAKPLANAFDVGPFGHRDLAGNVREWLRDRPGAADDIASAGIHGALAAGGSWSDEMPQVFTTTYAESVPPSYVGPVFGFRILVELP